MHGQAIMMQASEMQLQVGAKGPDWGVVCKSVVCELRHGQRISNAPIALG